MRLNSRGATGSRITITGLDEVKEAFRRLPDKVATKVVKAAEKTALGIPRDSAKANWPVRSGKSRRTIRVRVSKGPKGTTQKNTIALALLVGGAGADKKGKARPWWSFLIEHGWILGKRIRVGKKVVGRHQVAGGNRRIPGKHVMKKALRATEERVKQLMSQEIAAGIEREAAKK